MSNFAKITLVQQYRRVCYYTLTINDEDTSLFEQFVVTHTSENKPKLNHIMAWLDKIGNKVGAYRQYFRNESETADTAAIPPKGVGREPVYIETDPETGTDTLKPNNLRLYCFRANEHVVFLFNGAIKTAQRAQDCKNVKPHFKLANELAQALQNAFKEKDICWKEDFTNIKIEKDFLLEW